LFCVNAASDLSKRYVLTLTKRRKRQLRLTYKRNALLHHLDSAALACCEEFFHPVAYLDKESIIKAKQVLCFIDKYLSSPNSRMRDFIPPISYKYFTKILYLSFGYTFASYTKSIASNAMLMACPYSPYLICFGTLFIYVYNYCAKRYVSLYICNFSDGIATIKGSIDTYTKNKTNKGIKR